MSFRILSKYLLVTIFALLVIGCSTFKQKLPTILTSKEQQWTIPMGVAFKAIQKPAYPNLTEFIVTDGDLAIIYKGNLLELEQEANRRAVKAARAGKQQGAIWGAITSLLTLLGGIFAKMKLTKKKGEK